MSYLEDTKIDRNLVLEFFLRFSRFEFALKVTGHALGDHKAISPDWDGFAAQVRDGFDKNRSKELAAACDYYLLHPPMKQVLIDDSMGWSTDLPIDPARETELLIALVRRVRNNLFHGGKYNAEVHEETARSEELLRGGLLILDECLRSCPDVEHAFYSAAI